MGKQVSGPYPGTGAGLSFEVVENLKGFVKKEGLSPCGSPSSEKYVRLSYLVILIELRSLMYSMYSTSVSPPS